MMHYSRTASAIGVIEVASILTTERSGPLVDSVEAEFSPDIRLVRNGVLPGYDKTTVGKALEGSFQNSNWRSFTTAKGVEVIEYTRTITPLGLKDAGFSTASAEITEWKWNEKKAATVACWNDCRAPRLARMSSGHQYGNGPVALTNECITVKEEEIATKLDARFQRGHLSPSR
jgi:hypothetical protein